MKTITVRKRKSRRVGGWFVTVLIFAAALLCTIWLREVRLLLLFLPWLLLESGVLVYLESWQIQVSPDGISQRIFGLPMGSWSYREITDAYRTYSRTEKHYLMLSFTNGRKIKFRLEDENGAARRCAPSVPTVP